MRDVLTVSSEQFIPTHTREQHGSLFASLAAYEVGRDNSRVGRRLIHVPHESGQKVCDVGLDYDALILAAEMTCESCRNFRIVQRSFPDAVLPREGNGVSANGLVRLLAPSSQRRSRNPSPALRNAPIGTSLTI